MIAALALGAGVLGAAVALAPSASAYPEAVINLTVDRQTLFEGEQFTATGTSNVDCDWTTEWNDVVRTGTGSNGSPFQTTYTAPDVEDVTKIPLNGVCQYTDPSTESGERTAAGDSTFTRTIIITVLPRNAEVSPPNEGGLPNTGGPNALILLGGFGLLATGTTAVTVARRRAVEMDAAPRQA